MADDKAMFLSLRAHMKKEQFPKCIEVCDQILAVLPGDVDALKVKVSSFVALDKIEEALKICTNVKELSFEKAYCLYRLNKVCLKCFVHEI
jgi:signal recognition particle subunit SRP72